MSAPVALIATAVAAAALLAGSAQADDAGIDLESLYIEPDAGVPAPPLLPLPPPTPPKVLRPQAPTPAPPPALALELDPASTNAGCFAWSPTAATGICVLGQASLQAGGVYRLELPGLSEAPYVLWTEQTIHDGGQSVPADPVELAAARKRFAELGAVALGPGVEMEAPGQEYLALAEARLIWKRHRVRTEGHPLSGRWEVARHTVVLSCGARRARLFEAVVGGGEPRLHAWVLGDAPYLLAELTTTFGLEGDSGGDTQAVQVDLRRVCRRR